MRLNHGIKVLKVMQTTFLIKFEAISLLFNIQNQQFVSFLQMNAINKEPETGQKVQII